MPELSKAEKEFLLRKHELTKKLRVQFQKEISNPHKHALGTGGHVFDPALQRHQAMTVSHVNFFKPTGRTFRMGIFTVVLPMCLTGWALYTERNGREKKYRNGEVAYKDRRFKFV